jgi:hypothetical protein
MEHGPQTLLPPLLMAEAELTGINGDQWGGRHGRTAPDLHVRKVLFWEYGRNARLTLGGHYGDLMSCYDRKRVPLSNIAAQKKGMYTKNCISRTLTMLGAERFVKGDVGTLWDIISSILLTAHSNLVPGVIMGSADNFIEQRRVNDGYIDDIGNLADAPETNRAPECIQRLTQSAQCWATIVLVAGHILGFHKGGWVYNASMDDCWWLHDACLSQRF